MTKWPNDAIEGVKVHKVIPRPTALCAVGKNIFTVWPRETKMLQGGHCGQQLGLLGTLFIYKTIYTCCYYILVQHSLFHAVIVLLNKLVLWGMSFVLSEHDPFKGISKIFLLPQYSVDQITNSLNKGLLMFGICCCCCIIKFVVSVFSMRLSASKPAFQRVTRDELLTLSCQ
jgi:hypothetical protein